MTVVAHGVPGCSLTAAARGGRDAARRGSYFERVTGAALHRWLDERPDTCHLFHDVSDLRQVTGAGLPPLRLGGTNIDHVVLSGDGWLLIDAKGCGSGHLQVLNGKGVLVHDGTVIPQPWMDETKAYARAGALVRLTAGKPGFLVWVVPDGTEYGSSITRARFLAKGGCVLSPSDIVAGVLDEF